MSAVAFLVGIVVGACAGVFVGAALAGGRRASEHSKHLRELDDAIARCVRDFETLRHTGSWRMEWRDGTDE